jgi:hypothetical protein
VRLALFVLVVFGPPVCYGLILLVLNRRRAKKFAMAEAMRRANQVSVRDLVARIEREREIDANRTNRVRERQRGLPAGWVWPNGDPDGRPARALPPRPMPPRPRPYLRHLRAGWRTSSIPADPIADHGT